MDLGIIIIDKNDNVNKDYNSADNNIGNDNNNNNKFTKFEHTAVVTH